MCVCDNTSCTDKDNSAILFCTEIITNTICYTQRLFNVTDYVSSSWFEGLCSNLSRLFFNLSPFMV